MEINLGTKIITLVDKDIIERDDTHIFIPKGLVGYVCDTEYIKEGFVMVQFFEKSITENGVGVYSYKVDEIKPEDQ